ncbi:MAG: hypothetical protein Q4D29_10135 [Lachnospiraceae bacterium]|nr:hypothetical protein [Lachnospiraceae bacterium]
MARLKLAKTEEELKGMRIADIKKSYLEIGSNYNKMIDGDLLKCPSCGDFMKADTAFYYDDKYATNRYPICKRCLMKMVEQRKFDKDEPNETKESVQRVLQMMDRVYDDHFYEECVKGAYDEVKEKNRNSPFSTYITALQSLPNWKGKTWKDSDFGIDDVSIKQKEINENSRILKTAKKRFGNGYNSQDLVWLENEYQDWIKRYPCENKSQEILYKQICFTELNIDKAQKDGKDTKDLLKSLQDIMTSLQIKPSQSNSNALTEAKTFGQLIEKWEDEWDGGKPIPTPDKDFEDCDHVIRYIDTFFKGHLAKMVGLKNGFSRLYDKFISKYTVNKPQYDEDSDSEAIFDQLFGKDGDDL